MLQYERKDRKPGARAREAEELSGFLWKQYNITWNEAERILIFKWKQLLESRFHLFDVHNKHQCFRDTRPGPGIIKPFDAVDNFYGCVRCGKFHICKLHSDSCVIITRESDTLKTCRYSGRLLPTEDNLEVGNWDDILRTAKEASYVTPPRRNDSSSTNTAVLTQRLDARNRATATVLDLLDTEKQALIKAKRQGKKRKRVRLDRASYADQYDISIDSIEVSSSDDESDDADREERKEKERIDAERDRLGSLHMSEDEARTRQAQKEWERKRTKYGIDCDNAPEWDPSYEQRQPNKKPKANKIDDVETPVELATKRANAVASGASPDDSSEVELEFDFSDSDEIPGGGGGGDEEYTEAGDTLAHTRTCIDYDDGCYIKNYHNNIQYNNEYYAYLSHIIKDPEPAGENDEKKTTNRFADLYARDIVEEQKVLELVRKIVLGSVKDQRIAPDEADEEEYETDDDVGGGGGGGGGDDDDSNGVTEKSVVNVFKTSLLNESVVTKIADECRTVIGILLRIKVERGETRFDHSSVEYNRVLQRLVEYFARLVRNITLLVYQSSVLDDVARDRSLKNQNQNTRASCTTIDLDALDNLQRNVDYHEYTLCPTKICRSLLLHLFVNANALNDGAGYRVPLWGRDSWLKTFNNDRAKYNIITDYYNKMISLSVHQGNMSVAKLNNRERQLHCEIFRDGLVSTSALINDCLVAYGESPLWLRAMIFK